MGHKDGLLDLHFQLVDDVQRHLAHLENARRIQTALVQRRQARSLHRDTFNKIQPDVSNWAAALTSISNSEGL